MHATIASKTIKSSEATFALRAVVARADEDPMSGIRDPGVPSDKWTPGRVLRPIHEQVACSESLVEIPRCLVVRQTDEAVARRRFLTDIETASYVVSVLRRSFNVRTADRGFPRIGLDSHRRRFTDDRALGVLEIEPWTVELEQPVFELLTACLFWRTYGTPPQRPPVLPRSAEKPVSLAAA